MLQHDRGEGDDRPLVEALAELYSYVYSVPSESVEDAATGTRPRDAPLGPLDRRGLRPASPLIEEERTALIRSYEALLAAVRTDAATSRE